MHCGVILLDHRGVRFGGDEGEELQAAIEGLFVDLFSMEVRVCSRPYSMRLCIRDAFIVEHYEAPNQLRRLGSF